MYFRVNISLTTNFPLQHTPQNVRGFGLSKAWPQRAGSLQWPLSRANCESDSAKGLPLLLPETANRAKNNRGAFTHMGSVVLFRTATMDLKPKTFGDWLKERRLSAHLSHQQVADRADASKAYISNIERNMPHSVSGALPRPSVEVVDKLCVAVGAPVAEGRLMAGYAPAETSPADADRTRLLFYFNDLPEPVRGDALAMIEALWRSQQARIKTQKHATKDKQKHSA
jgi:transcriptional regulator with XRE-family HTH domain